MGYLFLSLMLLLLHQAKLGFGCNVPIDCSAVTLMTGIDIIDCPDIPIPDGGKERGGGFGTPPVHIDCCNTYTFTGPDREIYIYDTPSATCPVALEIVDIDIDDGEIVTIRNTHCILDPAECKMYTFDHTATAPFTIALSNNQFKFQSGGKDVSVTFKIKNFECNECLPSDEQVGCEQPVWFRHGDYCYAPVCWMESWDWHEYYCEVVVPATTPYTDVSMAVIPDDSTRDFLEDFSVATLKLWSWIGLKYNDSFSSWDWHTGVGTTTPNTYNTIWDAFYPLNSANADCAGIHPIGVVRNAHCDTKYFSWCMMPAPGMRRRR